MHSLLVQVSMLHTGCLPGRGRDRGRPPAAAGLWVACGGAAGRGGALVLHLGGPARPPSTDTHQCGQKAKSE